MNILFCTDSDITIKKGGVNRVTHFISREFMKLPNWTCHLAYLSESTILPISDFNGKIHVDKSNAEEQLKDYIIKHEIGNVVVNLTTKHNIRFLLPILNKIASGIKSIHIIFCLHNCPGFEMTSINLEFDYIRSLRWNTRNFKSILISVINKTPVRCLFKRHLSQKYRFIYDYCDTLVLLSSHYILPYKDIMNTENTEKFTAICNPLIFSEVLPKEQIAEKEKEVIIVARLSETSKRISLALKIWNNIENSGLFNDWRLTIIGVGEDEKYYKREAISLGLTRVSFEGQQDPIRYYKRASIFLMTSANEGWGLTLTESLQMGVVPIAFDSYEALWDIIENNFTGIIVENNNIALFTEKLMWLMQHNMEREKMAANGLEACQKFCMDNVIQKWRELFSR